ncbi:hypothetical protein DPMN_103160 [Dreissena polymorpha]|uniref:Uncharacterized protein n=1 Tax=Dreissena polymorpha TaxID=45954 RepID=A0A9D4H5L8_DREPO|nr:hypothetical protein DPMN_103160 [Dreissena polymorpha]
MGTEVHRKMRNELNEYRGYRKQFLMATITSTKELEERDFSALHKFQQFLSTIQDMVDKQTLTSKSLIHHGRCIFILNMPTEKDNTHGEA